jgi:uncharacterized protein (DUF2267 family)
MVPESRVEPRAAAALPPGEGVAFPGGSTTPTGRGILADAARAADAGLAARIEQSAAWRRDYARFVREVTAVSARSPNAARAVAQAGLRSMRSRMIVDRDGAQLPLADALATARPGALGSRTLTGAAARETELRIPYRDRELHGDALRAQLERWMAAGILEPSAAEAVRRVMDHPEWLSLPGRRVAVIGAGAEMGPLEPLARWGARLLAVDVPDDAVQRHIAAVAARGAGPVTVPTMSDGRAGADLVAAFPEVRGWLDAAAGDEPLALGMYAYADGGLHVRLTAAFDALATGIVGPRPDTALAFLATPTDAFAVPGDAVADARAGSSRRRARRLAEAPLRLLSRGRLAAPPYGEGDAIADVLVAQQGPNYALAKRLQRWRGMLAAADGRLVSFNVAPATWTRSVTRNRVLAAAYHGAHRFGIEIFAPETARTLMAALLVHDLHREPRPPSHPEALFADGAVHGGLWRRPYDPRSMLPLAALLGAPAVLRPRSKR